MGYETETVVPPFTLFLFRGGGAGALKDIVFT